MDNTINHISAIADGVAPLTARREVNAIRADNIPSELKQFAQWVCWRNDFLPNGKRTKVPYDPRTIRHASVNNPATWADFQTTLEAARANYFDGIGFVLTQSDPFCIIDLDDKLENPLDEGDRKTQCSLLEMCPTYIELSPSGRGHHIVMRGKVPHGLKRGSIEIYSSSRYMTFTGNVVKAGPIMDCQEILDQLVPLMLPHAPTPGALEFHEPVLSDARVAELAQNAANGEKYTSICNIGSVRSADGRPVWDQNRVLADCKELGYPSQSEADLALLSMICFYTQSNDQAKRLFRFTGLGQRPKARVDDRYLDRTILQARLGQATNSHMHAATNSVVEVPSTNSGTGGVKAHPHLPGFADELLALPHGLGAIQQWVLDTMKYPSRATAGITALALLTHCAMAHLTIASYDGLGLNEQYMILAPTGFGKEDTRKPFGVIARVLTTTQLAGLALKLPRLQYSAPASQQGLHDLLQLHPAQTFLSDEFGDWLAHSERDLHKQAALGYFMQAYSKATTTIATPHGVSRQYVPVDRPRVLVFATSTAERMMEALTLSQAESGALNRFVMLAAEQDRLEKRYEGHVYEPPVNVTDLLSWVITLPETVIRFSDEAWIYFMTHDRDVMEPLKFKGPALAGRLSEQAIKMAALIALSDRRVEIQRRDLEIALKIRENLYYRASALIDESGAISGLHETAKAVEQLTGAFQRLRHIARAHLQNHSRAYRRLDVRAREAVVRALLESGVCQVHPARRGLLCLVETVDGV